MTHVDKFGVGNVVAFALEYLKGRPLHCSYDIDAVDPTEAPATGTVVRGGLTFREAHFIAEELGACGQLGSMDLVEVNPMLLRGNSDASRQTAELGAALIASCMGSSII